MTEPGPSQGAAGASSATWSPWRSVVAFGVVSLTADMLYEGMRAVIGPFLGVLGASALVVGVVTGAGEGIALVLRLVTGAWADRRDRHWRLTVVGYAMTAVCVPLLAVTPFLGGAGLAVAVVLVLLERTGKAVRSPAKSALLARMATTTGRGRGFGVHKALDQVGAFSGPLVLAGATAVTGVVWPGFAVLALPGAACLLLLAVLRRRAPIEEPAEERVEEPAGDRAGGSYLAGAVGLRLPGAFHVFSASAALTTAGLMTFGVMSFRMVEQQVVTLAAVPLVYAAGMAAGAVAALVAGDAHDRWGARVLLVVPPAVAVVPFLVFGDQVAMVLVGIAVWGAAGGVQDSTVKAYVADLVAPGRRATAFGVFAAVQGVGALAGGVLAGALVDDHLLVLLCCLVALQVAAFLLLWRVTRASGPAEGSGRRISRRGVSAGGAGG